MGDFNVGYVIMFFVAFSGKWDICLDIGIYDKI